MRHYATVRFWSCYRALPREVQLLADRKHALLARDPDHPSLRLKRLGSVWSVRVGLHYRALGLDAPGEIHWFWIGTHAEYDRIVTGA